MILVITRSESDQLVDQRAIVTDFDNIRGVSDTHVCSFVGFAFVRSLLLLFFSLFAHYSLQVLEAYACKP